MRMRLAAAMLLGLALSSQALAQVPVPVLNVVGNLTGQPDSLLATGVADTARSLNDSLGGLHQGLSAGTPLATNNRAGHLLIVLGTPHLRRLDRVLSGEEPATLLLQQIDPQKLAAVAANLGTTMVMQAPNFLLDGPSALGFDANQFIVTAGELSPLNNLYLTAAPSD